MIELNNYLKPLTDKNAQLVTRYIKNWADSAKFQVRSLAFNFVRFDSASLRNAQLFIYPSVSNHKNKKP